MAPSRRSSLAISASSDRAAQYARWRELRKLRAAGEPAAPAGRQPG
jgi:hypothetical protein